MCPIKQIEDNNNHLQVNKITKHRNQSKNSHVTKPDELEQADEAFIRQENEAEEALHNIAVFKSLDRSTSNKNISAIEKATQKLRELEEKAITDDDVPGTSG